MHKTDWEPSLPCGTLNWQLLWQLWVKKALLGIRDVSCGFCQDKIPTPYMHFATGTMKTELKLATFLGVCSTEEPWECLTGACPLWPLCCSVCSLTCQCCWEPPQTLRYLPKMLPSGHTKRGETFACCWSFSSFCQVSRAVCQDAGPKSPPSLPRRDFLFNSCTSMSWWAQVAGISQVGLPGRTELCVPCTPWVFLAVPNSCLCCL